MALYKIDIDIDTDIELLKHGLIADRLIKMLIYVNLGVSVTTEAEFAGEGSYIELPRQLLPHTRDSGEEIIRMTVTTDHENALIFWHGQTPTISGRGKDYIAIAIRDGYPVFR